MRTIGLPPILQRARSAQPCAVERVDGRENVKILKTWFFRGFLRNYFSFLKKNIHVSRIIWLIFEIDNLHMENITPTKDFLFIIFYQSIKIRERLPTKLESYDSYVAILRIFILCNMESVLCCIFQICATISKKIRITKL